MSVHFRRGTLGNVTPRADVSAVRHYLAITAYPPLEMYHNFHPSLTW